MAKTNVKRKESKDTVEDESNESVVSGGEKVDFTADNNTKKVFNDLVENFNIQVNGNVSSLKEAINAYDFFIVNTTDVELKTAAITAINDAVTNSGVSNYVTLNNDATPKNIYDNLKIVYDGYQAIYTAAKNKYNKINSLKA